MRKTAFILVGLGLVGVTFLSGGVRLNFFNIQTEGRDFIVTWNVDVEEDVHEYELLRKTTTSNDQFVKVFTARPHGTGKDYLFRDSQVYKSGSEQLDYRLDAVYSSGLREIIITKSINYTSTAVRRTWGSLKALFQ